MNNNQNPFGNKKIDAKLALENTAFNNCREDMSDVKFEIGRKSYTIKVFSMIVIFALIFGGRIMLRRRAGNPDFTMSALDTAVWTFIGFIAVCTVIASIMQSLKPSISVSGKTIFYNGNCWTCNEISCVEVTKLLGCVNVYSNGKRIISFLWEKDNSELFIAWAKKCGIVFEDKRK